MPTLLSCHQPHLGCRKNLFVILGETQNNVLEDIFLRTNAMRRSRGLPAAIYGETTHTWTLPFSRQYEDEGAALVAKAQTSMSRIINVTGYCCDVHEVSLVSLFAFLRVGLSETV